MLYQLHKIFDINLFQYITFRAGVAFFIAFFLSVFLMPIFIRWATKKKANQPISDYVKAHEEKKNTPTMGGLVFIASAVIATLLTARLGHEFVKISLLCIILFCLIGLIDDFMKISVKKNAGMSSRLKFFLLFLVSFCISLLIFSMNLPPHIYVPILKKPLINLEFMPHLIVLFWIFVFLATTNAVNITDGLDGLATVPSICALISLSIFLYVTGNFELSKYLFWPKVVGAGEIVVISMALIGSLFGFLWFNCHPAEVFMGDSGSLALGGFIAFGAIISRNEILLILIGSIFVIETISVMLQVGSYKIRKKRIFLMAPIHHHFEVKGWVENKIIVRFWIIAIISNIIALITLKIR